MLRILIGFFIGTAVGAAAALLLAPSSGEDLRNQMTDHANADMQRMREEYSRGMDELHTRMDKLHKDKGGDEVVVEEELVENVETDSDAA